MTQTTKKILPLQQNTIRRYEKKNIIECLYNKLMNSNSTGQKREEEVLTAVKTIYEQNLQFLAKKMAKMPLAYFVVQMGSLEALKFCHQKEGIDVFKPHERVHSSETVEESTEVNLMYEACSNGHLHIVEYLATHMPNPSQICYTETDEDGGSTTKTPLAVACSDGQVAVFEALQKHMAINSDKGQTETLENGDCVLNLSSLACACDEGQFSIVRVFPNAVSLGKSFGYTVHEKKQLSERLTPLQLAERQLAKLREDPNPDLEDQKNYIQIIDFLNEFDLVDTE